MTLETDYDYRELAYDLYQAGDDLLRDLVAMRKQRGMTQADLAEEMGVTQSAISQIETGKTGLVSLLTDYALEVGVRIEYALHPAEEQSRGSRATMVEGSRYRQHASKRKSVSGAVGSEGDVHKLNVDEPARSPLAGNEVVESRVLPVAQPA